MQVIFIKFGINEVELLSSFIDEYNMHFLMGMIMFVYKIQIRIIYFTNSDYESKCLDTSLIG